MDSGCQMVVSVMLAAAATTGKRGHARGTGWTLQTGRHCKWDIYNTTGATGEVAQAKVKGKLTGKKPVCKPAK